MEAVKPSAEEEVTRLLERWKFGDPEALDTLIPLVFDELRAIAGRLFRHEDPDNTLQPTALVNMLYIRFVQCESVDWINRDNFFGGADHIMRQLLTDHARQRKAAKRGGDVLRLPVAEELPARYQVDPVENLVLYEALERLEATMPRQAKVVSLKLIWGFTIRGIAKALDIRLTTVKKDWRFARAWLLRELGSP